jgi:hypothetical protein
MEEARGTRARFSLFFKLTRIERRMFRLPEASVSCSNLFTVATCEHVDSASSTTRLQLISGGAKPDTPRLAMPEDLGAGAVLPEASLLGTSMLAPHLTKSRMKPPTS